MRAALGYPRINLYGTSYGTRVAQHYLRRFPQRVRSVILDGVVPAPLALGPEVAQDSEHALLDVLGRCAAQPPCRGRYGDPSTGEPRRFDFGTEQLATMLRLRSYSADYAARRRAARCWRSGR